MINYTVCKIVSPEILQKALCKRLLLFILLKPFSHRHLHSVDSFTFTFIHLGDAFIQSDLQVKQNQIQEQRC